MLNKVAALFRDKAGERLKILRELLGLSQEGLGRLLRPENPFPKGTISSWETGVSPVPEEMLNKAAGLATQFAREARSTQEAL